jgi:hypothetical protein
MTRLANILNKKINVIGKLSNDESNLIKFHCNRINWLRKKLLQLNQIINIHDEIKNAIDSNNTENSHRLISEIFTNFRSFLDYWETDIKREFGKDSKQIIAFKNRTHIEYDNVFAYRFINELRNYIQHCGMPEILVKKKLDENDNTVISLNLNAQNLLKNFDWKPKVKKDLCSPNIELDLLEIFQCLIKSIERINNTAISLYDIEGVVESCNYILEYEKYKIESSTLALVDFPSSYPENISGDTSILCFPFDIANHFKESIKFNNL